MSDPNSSNAVQMLPPGWVALESQTAGVYYYYNTYTGVTQWERPIVPVHPPQPPPTSATAPPPPPTTTEKPKKKKKEKIPIPGTDWLLVRTPDGLEFYFHKETKTSVWEIPAEIEDAVKGMKEQEEASKKRKLEDEKAEEPQDVKRQKSEQEEEEEPQAGTEMTEEDIMWQLQNMDPEEAAALGLPVEEPKKEEEEKATATEAPEEKSQQQPSSGQDQMSNEERIEKFTQMLSEKNISPFSTWERELPKFINDPRYSLVEPHSKRKNLFNNFCRVLAEQQKANKPKAKDPEEEYLDLVKEIANAKMYWDDFRRKAKNDKRFKAIRESRVRESIFKDYVKELRKNAEKGGGKKSKEDAYKDLLRETKEIRPGMRWRDAKVILEKDKRYHDIESKTHREDMFRDYLETLE